MTDPRSIIEDILEDHLDDVNFSISEIERNPPPYQYNNYSEDIFVNIEFNINNPPDLDILNLYRLQLNSKTLLSTHKPCWSIKNLDFIKRIHILTNFKLSKIYYDYRLPLGSISSVSTIKLLVLNFSK